MEYTFTNVTEAHTIEVSFALVGGEMDLVATEGLLKQLSTQSNQLLDLVRQLIKGNVFDEPLTNQQLINLRQKAVTQHQELTTLSTQLKDEIEAL